MTRQYKNGVDRLQESFLPARVEDYVSEDNHVRAIDAYVDSLDLVKLEFKNSTGNGKSRGQPAFSPATHLKLYLWGYMNRVHSSRRLELDCRRNLELIWLLNSLQPGYHSIADFRKDNPKSLRKVHREFVLLCKELDLFSCELVAIDSVYFEGNASRNSVYSNGRLKALIEKIDKDIEHYNKDLDRSETVIPLPSTQKLSDKIARLEDRRQILEGWQDELEESEAKQISFTDPDARILSKRTAKGPTVGYAVQAVVDSKNKLLATCDVTVDITDQQALVESLENAKEILGVEDITALADGGYFSAKGVEECEKKGINLYMPLPKKVNTSSSDKFNQDDFEYDKDKDLFVCPAGKELTMHGVYPKGASFIARYFGKESVCKKCKQKDACIKGATKYRTVSRTIHSDALERHKIKMQERGPDMMKLRASLAEHPFGTMKLWLGWTHFLVRGIEKVKGEMAILSTAYNLKRVLNIIGIEKFIARCTA